MQGVATLHSTIINQNFSVMYMQGKMKRGTYRVKYLPKSAYEKYDLGRFPNFDKSGNVMGMKNLYYGLDAKLVRCGNYIYNVTSSPEIYDAAN